MTYKTYKMKRYIFFWLTLIVYFVPYIVATACLLPFMKATEGTKWAIGLTVALLNALPFVMGIFRKIFAHVPFINVLAIVFVALAMFFTLETFHSYVYTFMTIESAALAGSVVSCVLWHFHMKYKRKAQTVSTMFNKRVVSDLREAMKDD